MSDLIPAWVNGILTPVDKLEVHRMGLRHPAVSVFVLAGQEVLLQRRALGKYHTPGLWANTCCSHPHWGETAASCARRRLWQELGIADADPVYRDRIEYRAEVGGGLTEHEVVELFVVNAPRDLAVNLNPAEVAEVLWIGVDDLKRDVAINAERYTPWLRIYLAEHEDRIFRSGSN